MNVQARVALEKEAHPERFCPERRCLWRSYGALCPRHHHLAPSEAAASEDPAYIDREEQRLAIYGERW